MHRRPYVPPETVKPVFRFKWRDDLLVEGFTPVPKKLIRSMYRIFVGPEAMEKLAVVLAIVDYKRPTQVRGPSLSYLAYLTDLPESTFRRHLKDLEAEGLARVEGGERAMEVSLEGLFDRIQKETPDTD